jgi:TolB-like protein
MAVKDPDDRIQTCDAVIAALESIEQELRGSDGGSVPTHKVPPTRVQAKLDDQPTEPQAPSAGPLPPVSTGSKKSMPLVLGGVAGVVVVGVIAAVLMQKPKTVEVTSDPPPVVIKQPPIAKQVEPPPQNPPPVVSGPLRVAVLKFKNVGNDAKLAVLEGGVPETAATKLAGTPGVTMIERSDLESEITEIDRRGDVHFDPSTIARMGQLKGIEVAVQGGFQRAGREVRISARLVKVENGEILSTFQVTHSARDLFGAQDALADGLLPKLKTLAAQREKK